MSAPDFESLRKLRDMLPAVAEGLVQGKLSGKGKKIPIRRPNKTCPICCTMFDFVMVPDAEQWNLPTAQHCEKCAGMIGDGYVALVCGDRYAFVKSKMLEQLEERVVTMEPEQMNQISKAFDAEWKQKELP